MTSQNSPCEKLESLVLIMENFEKREGKIRRKSRRERMELWCVVNFRTKEKINVMNIFNQTQGISEVKREYVLIFWNI